MGVGVKKILVFLWFLCALGSAMAADSLELASKAVARALAAQLANRSIAINDFRDQEGNVRELGRIIADQYLRSDISELGVRGLSRNQLTLILKNGNMTQSTLLENIVLGKPVDLRGVDTLITGTISLIGDRYTIVAEALDVKSGFSLANARSDFPQSPTFAGSWDNIVERSGDVAAVQSSSNSGSNGSSVLSASSSVVNNLNLPTKPIVKDTMAVVMSNPQPNAAEKIVWSHANDAFFNNRDVRSRFTLIDRQQVDAILQEYKLGQLGIINEKTSTQLGQLLGVQYLAVVNLAETTATPSSISLFGVRSTQAQLFTRINISIIDTTSGAILSYGTGTADKFVFLGVGIGDSSIEIANYQAELLGLFPNAVSNALVQALKNLR
jgi:hypothetical protein